MLAAHHPGHLLSSLFQVKPIHPSISAMASGNDGDPLRDWGRRGSNRQRPSQELNSGKKVAVIFRGGRTPFPCSISLERWGFSYPQGPLRDQGNKPAP